MTNLFDEIDLAVIPHPGVIATSTAEVFVRDMSDLGPGDRTCIFNTGVTETFEVKSYFNVIPRPEQFGSKRQYSLKFGSSSKNTNDDRFDGEYAEAPNY